MVDGTPYLSVARRSRCFFLPSVTGPVDPQAPSTSVLLSAHSKRRQDSCGETPLHRRQPVVVPPAQRHAAACPRTEILSWDYSQPACARTSSSSRIGCCCGLVLPDGGPATARCESCRSLAARTRSGVVHPLQTRFSSPH